MCALCYQYAAIHSCAAIGSCTHINSVPWHKHSTARHATHRSLCLHAKATCLTSQPPEPRPVLLLALQTFEQLRDRGPHQQQAQPLLPHTHWQYWLQFSAEDFPASATRAPQKPDSSQAPETEAAACDSSSSSRGCNSQQADSTAQQPVAIVAGACDITIIKRSLVQQLYNAAPAPFKGPAASALKAPLKGSSSSQSAQQAVTEGLQPANSSEQRRNRLSDTSNQILLRVAPGHKGFVAGLLSDILQDHWMQKQQKYLRLVSTSYSSKPWSAT